MFKFYYFNLMDWKLPKQTRRIHKVIIHRAGRFEANGFKAIDDGWPLEVV